MKLLKSNMEFYKLFPILFIYEYSIIHTFLCLRFVISKCSQLFVDTRDYQNHILLTQQTQCGLQDIIVIPFS